MPTLYLRTFGGLSIENGGRPIAGAAAQRGRLAILAAIAASGDRGISRDRLLALFWPESDAEHARAALRQALYALRRDLGAEDLTRGTAQLHLNDAIIGSDVGDFRRALASVDLEIAAACYRAPFLDGVYLKDAPEFERWSERERDELAADYRGVLERAALLAGERGDRNGAAAWWRRLAAADPLSSRITRSYMDALTAAGDREAAIRHAGIYAELVRAELRAEPDDDVMRYAESLRKGTGSPGLEQASHLASSSLQVTADSAATPVSPTPNARAAASPRRRFVLAALLLAPAVLVPTILFGPWNRRSGGLPPLVLIAPVENLTGDSGLNGIGRIAAEWVTNGISRIDQVGAVNADALLTGPSPVSQLVNRTAPELVVRATYRTQSDSIEFSASLLEGRNGERFAPYGRSAPPLPAPRLH